MKKLLLAGAGHAHIGLLHRLGTGKSAERLADTDITLITEQPNLIYSGMLPVWMAGHYQFDDICIDIKALCVQAGVRFIQSSLIKVEATSQTVMTADNERSDYDVLSLNTGADTDMRWLDSAAKTRTTNDNLNAVIPIRPLSAFIEHWQQILEEAKQATNYRLAIVGAGAAATELAMSAQFALQRINPKHQVYLICGEQLLSGFNQGFRQRVNKQLKRHNIEVIYDYATGYKDGQLLTTEDELKVDAVIAATGVMGAAWTEHTDLETIAVKNAKHGFIAVNAIQQSISHSNVFAVGDVATRVDQEVAHSGVHAVNGGAVEVDNLLAYLANEPLQAYQPKKRTLYLLSCGNKYVIASWGNYSLQGRWLWYVKRRIDRRFVNSYQN